ncbi:MAG: hypothetical protein AAFX76_08330 [Planctomycetota bacterium]
MTMPPGSHPTEPDVRERVRDHYTAQRLGSERMRAILDGVAAEIPAASGRRGQRAWSRWAAAAAVGLAGLLAGAAWWASGPAPPPESPPESTPEWATLVAREIALNHNKALGPDYAAAGFDELASMRVKLGFTPFEPAGWEERGLRLVGARYCSVQGCMATQMRVVDGDGEAWTLYQVRPDERLARLNDSVVAVDGVEVELWREAGLVMGLARSR